jgi:hypothetical protein
MKTFLIRIFSLAILGIVSGSVLSISFPGSAIFPVFIFAFAIALALSRGFLESLPAVVALGLFADLATLGRVGVLSGFAVGLAYTASFFSRRFIVEHAAFTIIFSGLLSGVAAIFFPVFSGVLLHETGGFLIRLTDIFSIASAVALVVSGVVAFALASILLRRYDELISRIDPGSAMYVRRQRR